MADKHGRRKIFTVFGTLVITPIVIITNLPPVPLAVALAVSAVFFIFSNGRMCLLQPWKTAVIKPEVRGSNMSIRSSVQQLTAGIASFLGGIIITKQPSIFDANAKALVNYPYVGIIAVFFSLVSLNVARSFLWWANRQTQRSHRLFEPQRFNGIEFGCFVRRIVS